MYMYALRLHQRTFIVSSNLHAPSLSQKRQLNKSGPLTQIPLAASPLSLNARLQKPEEYRQRVIFPPHQVVTVVFFRVLHESTHVLERLVTSRAFVLAAIIEVPLGRLASPCTVVDVPQLDTRHAGLLFQVQDHGGFRLKDAMTRIASGRHFTMSGVVLLRVLGSVRVVST